MPVKILVLDDEIYIREGFKDFFLDMGWDVVVFGSAEEALDYVEIHRVDCMTVDLRLPGMNGIDFILQAHNLQPHSKFVIYTGSIDFVMSDELKNLGPGIVAVVRKPVHRMEDIVDAFVDLGVII